MKVLLSIITMLLCSLGIAADKYSYFYQEAVRQQNMQNFTAAFELFRHCLDINPDASEANYAIASFYMALQQDSLGLHHFKRATELEPDNVEFGERLAQTYLYQNRIAEATEVYEKLVAKNPDRTDFLELLLRIYNQQHDYPMMLETLNRMETQEGQSENITLEKMQAHSLMNDNEGAYRELKSLIDAHPFDMSLQVMLGNWFLNTGKKDEALKTYQKVIAEEPDNAQCQMALMDYYRSEGQTDLADDMLYNMLINPRADPDTRVELIRSWVNDSEANGGDSLHVLQVFDKVLAMPQKTSEVAAMKVAYLQMKHAEPASIRTALEEVLRITPENISARMQLIQLMWNDSVDENVIRECRKAVEYVPDEPMLYYYLGLAQYINEHNQDAIEALRNGAGNITSNTDKKMAADIYALLGDIYHKVGRKQDAYAAYDSCLVYNPDNVGCLNNYAYFLSLEGKDLKKAEKMSYRTITVEANNPTYLDTYAWILYKQKRYQDAKAYIDMATELLKEGDDPEGEIKKHAEMIEKKLK